MPCPLLPGYVLPSDASGSQSVPDEQPYCRFQEYQSELLSPDDTCSRRQWSVNRYQYGLVYVQQPLRYASWEYRFRWLLPYRPASLLPESIPKPCEPTHWSNFPHNKSHPMGLHSCKCKFLPEYKSAYYVQYVQRNPSARQ